MTDKPEPSLADLCKPLSAKVMPARYRWSISGREMSEAFQIKAQREGRRIKYGKRKRASK